MDVPEAKLTPAMQQLKAAKDAYPDCIILVRMGDFYELFYDDAITASQVLGITLTSRGKGEHKAPLAGIPHHALDTYLAKFVREGYKVAICEQLEDPKKAKGLVKRGVVRVVTPGTIFEENLLDKDTNNFLVSVAYDYGTYGVAYCDVSTGEFQTTQIDTEASVVDELTRLGPSEVVIADSLLAPKIEQHMKNYGIFVSRQPSTLFGAHRTKQILCDHFRVATLDGFGFSSHPVTRQASGALLAHLHHTQKQTLHHITSVKHYSLSKEMQLDSATIRNLELVHNIRDHQTSKTLFETLNHCVTPMGMRRLRSWMLRPLRKKDAITQRHDAVAYLTEDVTRLRTLRGWLKNTCDLFRVLSRLSHQRGSARDLVAIKDTLRFVQRIARRLESPPSLLMHASWDNLFAFADRIDEVIVDEPPASVREGGMIRAGVDAKLDATRSLRNDAAMHIRRIEERERQETGITSLKVKYNRVFGYFIEVTKRYLDLVPETYIRKQTIAQGERYITEELKELEHKILTSEEDLVEQEHAMFQHLVTHTLKHVTVLQNVGEYIAVLDCVCSFAECALRYNYTRPQLVDDQRIELVGSRHPVVERFQATFVPNDCMLDSKTRMLLITGPNMAGKSTYLRQVALTMLLSQIGSFVPCTQATVACVDRIFTRIGAYDDLSKGESTFMVEMAETANILHHATEHSLVILDEIGRGTSTYDGVSIAQAVFEYLHNNNKSSVLFATHYHHLNSLAHTYTGIRNVHMKVQEKKDGITFLHTVEEGGTDKSYGIHVAHLAGLPRHVIIRAQQIMKRIEALDVLEESVEGSEKRRVQPSLHAFIDHDNTKTQ